MEELKDQLQLISKSLVSLAKQVEAVSKYIEADKKAEVKAPSKPAAKKAKAPKKTKAKKAPAKKASVKAAKVAVDGSSVLDTVYDVIKRSRKGASIAHLREKTGLEARQISNALYKLTKKGMVQTKTRGVYSKA